MATEMLPAPVLDEIIPVDEVDMEHAPTRHVGFLVLGALVVLVTAAVVAWRVLRGTPTR
jgi:hypothetical protein